MSLRAEGLQGGMNEGMIWNHGNDGAGHPAIDGTLGTVYFVRAASQISQSLGNAKKKPISRVPWEINMKQSPKHGNRLHFPITIRDSEIH